MALSWVAASAPGVAPYKSMGSKCTGMVVTKRRFQPEERYTLHRAGLHCSGNKETELGGLCRLVQKGLGFGREF